MIIDSGELRQLKELKEFTNPKGIFYRKESDGSFSTCRVPERMEGDELQWEYFKLMTKDFLSKGLLFVNRNQPFKAVSI